MVGRGKSFGQQGDATHMACGGPCPQVTRAANGPCGRANVERTTKGQMALRHKVFRQKMLGARRQRRTLRTSCPRPVIPANVVVRHSPPPKRAALAQRGHVDPWRCPVARGYVVGTDMAPKRCRAVAHPATRRCTVVGPRFPHCFARANAATLIAVRSAAVQGDSFRFSTLLVHR